MFAYNLNEVAILDELNLLDLDAEVRQGILRKINDLLQERVGTRVEAELDRDDLRAFNELPDESQVVEAFLLQKLPNMSDIYQQELAIIVGQLKSTL